MTVKKILSAFSLLISLFLLPGIALSEPEITFSVKALFKDRAMIEINGTRHILSSGEESPEGVKLLSSNVNEANISCHGKEYTLYINQNVYSGTSVENKKSNFKIPKKFVPGKTIPFIQEELNGFTKYTLKPDYIKPSVIEYGQDAIWIGAGKELLRFDINKEAWGEFDLEQYIDHEINSLAISDKSVILNATKYIDDKKHSGLFLFNTRTSNLSYQLDSTPGNFSFVKEKLWFLDYAKGLGYFYPQTNSPNTSYEDALLYQEKSKDKEKDKTKNKKKDKNKRNRKKSENTYVFSSHDDDIWYSHHSHFRANDKNNRLHEVCVSHYNAKYKTSTRFTRREMGIDAKYNCSHLAVSKDQVWVSHDKQEAGLSVYNTATKQWKHISASANNMLIGGKKIMLDNDQLWMMSNNQLIGLNTETMHANVVLGDAVITQPWHSSFYVKNGYAWFTTKEISNIKPSKYRLVLYKVPILPNERQASLSKLN
jgi:hypothetical protein